MTREEAALRWVMSTDHSGVYLRWAVMAAVAAHGVTEVAQTMGELLVAAFDRRLREERTWKR